MLYMSYERSVRSILKRIAINVAACERAEYYKWQNVSAFADRRLFSLAHVQRSTFAWHARTRNASNSRRRVRTAIHRSNFVYTRAQPLIIRIDVKIRSISIYRPPGAGAIDTWCTTCENSAYNGLTASLIRTQFALPAYPSFLFTRISSISGGLSRTSDELIASTAGRDVSVPFMVLGTRL